MSDLLSQSPAEVVARLREEGGGAFAVRAPDAVAWALSHDWMDAVAAAGEEAAAGAGIEAVFLARGPETGALFGCFLHRLARGQAQGGLRRSLYPDLAAFVRDGARLAMAMGRKNALAGLWWSGGKGLIAAPEGPEALDPLFRRTLYREYGAFVSSLRGAYVTAEDAGTTPQDMAAVFETTRFATCIPEEAGGSGNPSAATARGVVCGLEAALEATGADGIAGGRFVVQGLGQVGMHVVAALLEAGAREVLGGDVDPERVREARVRFRDAPVEARHCAPDDSSLLEEPCDALLPCALGGVLGPATLAKLRTPLVCPAANNPLQAEVRDARAAAERGIVVLPDFVVNRMGIVRCANEAFGAPRPDPEVERHLDADDPEGIPAVVRRVLELAAARQTTPIEAAFELADARCAEAHPLFGDRARRIVRTLVEEGWPGSGA
ncbi:MAG: Glu/Leu/Phe/Val dehydrogenase dimerization domain-containing protein [Myxococcota bacterium]|nr:Glu/Leu/Phe/Val dehydrogenase dimerization domain-containing protein [Myxococcota bacterium]